MTGRTEARTARPYRYLDSYNMHDRDLYFGREREIKILHSDIVVNRLVILFAKTGTGKTSLINAGVRPRLEPDYKTFHVRVESDPTKAAKESLRSAGLLPRSLEAATLSQQLGHATRKLKRSVVLFFDQFEEFFEQIAKPTDRQRFIDDIAETYHDRECGARIVFSMREEYFHEMDDFREQVPSIFHKSSNLRLRPFDDDQARLAIVKPAEQYGVAIEADLTERLIDDLHTDEGILPTHLQIICDTLWRERRQEATSITLGNYLALGQGDGSAAERVYEHRIERDLNENLGEEQLERLRAMMPELRTAKHTKKPKELSELAQRLDIDLATLTQLAHELERIGLVRLVHRYGTTHVEWTSDYLASRTEDLIERTRKLSLLKLLMRGLERRRRLAQPDRVGEKRPAPLDLGDFRALSEYAPLIDAQIGADEAEFLFSASLHHGEHVELWSRIALERGVDVWHALESKITDDRTPLEEAGSALWFLIGSPADQAQRLLSLALQQDSLASLAIEVIADSGNPAATQLLRPTLEQPALAAHTVAALGQQSSDVAVDVLAAAVRHLGEVALQAAAALYKISTGRPSKAQETAAQFLPSLLDDLAEPLFVQALGSKLEPEFWFQQVTAHGVDAWGILERCVQDQAIPLRRAKNCLHLLGQLAARPASDPAGDRSLKLLALALADDRLAEGAVDVVRALSSSEAVRLLEKALHREATTLHAARSLYDIAWRRAGKASSEADDVVQAVFSARVGPLFVRALRQGETSRFWFDRASEYGIDVWGLMRSEIEQSASTGTSGIHVVHLLGELADDSVTRQKALELLQLATSYERVAAPTISAIGGVKAPEAVELLGSLLRDPSQSARARRALEGIADDWSTQPELRRRADELLHRLIDDAARPQVRAERRVRFKPQGQRLAPSDRYADRDWAVLLRTISDGRCTPIVGPASASPLPAPSEIAQQWAAEHEYPLENSSSLAAVAEFLAVTVDSRYPRDLLRAIYTSPAAVDKRPENEINALLADLPIPIYVSTAPDDLLSHALKGRGKRPRAIVAGLNHSQPWEQLAAYSPTPAEPVVLHLYGHVEMPDSVVLTDTDYLQMLESVSWFDAALGAVKGALATTSWLLLGVNPLSLDGRVLLRLMVGRFPGFRRANVAVLPPPIQDDSLDASRAQRYLGEYLMTIGFRIYWGDVQGFSTELHKRWTSFATGLK